jgi:GTPase SAR1 family protein
MLVPLMVVGSLAVVLAAGAVLLALQNSRLKTQFEEARDAWSALRDTPRQLEATTREAHDARQKLDSARRELDSVRQELGATQTELKQVTTSDKEKEGWLEHQERQIAWCNNELTMRPKIVRRSYKILTLGVSGTGKTALTLKWANPLVDLGTLQGTKVERYERTVSHRQEGDELTEHVFEVRDWGGEHIVDAQHELILDGVHGLLIVVDLARRDGTAVEPARIQEQLREFQPESLRYFFGPTTMAACQAVVLFINKSDVLSGTPAEVEREARRHYQRLIDDLQCYKSQLDVHVLVGSATYGHSTHHLFAHFVSRILPETAYDPQLLQRMKADHPTDAGTQPQPTGHGLKSNGAPSITAGLPALPAPVVRTSPPPLPAVAPAPTHRANPPAVVNTQRPVPPGMVVAANLPRPPSPGFSPATSTTTETTPHVARR